MDRFVSKDSYLLDRFVHASVETGREVRPHESSKTLIDEAYGNF